VVEVIDSRGLVHVPRWLKWTATLVLVALFALAVLVTAIFVIHDNPKDPKYADWILVGLATAQLSLTGAGIALVLFFAEREAGTASLQRRHQDFLSKSVPSVLVRVTSSYDLRTTRSRVVRLGESDIFGAAYEIFSGEKSIKVWLGLNVNRIFVIFWIDVDEGSSVDLLQEQVRGVFQFTFGGAEAVGYHTNYEAATLPDGHRVISIWSSARVDGHNLLTESAERLFWLQDVAMMTESFWRTAIRNNVKLSARDPSPL
jgi:hypothetical protein